MRVTPTCDSINSFCISNAASVQKTPDMVFNGGSYFVVWADARGGSYMVFGARVTTAGTVLDPSGIVISTGFGDTPVIDFDGSRHLVVWSNSIWIEGVFVTTGGATQDPITIATGTSSLYAPNIACDGTNYLVVWLAWNTSAYDIIGQRVSSTGSLIGSQFTVATTNIAIKPGITFDGNHYCINWTQSDDIWARQYDTAGNPLSPAFEVSSQADMQFFCDVTSGTDRYLFVWALNTGSGYDVYGNVDVPIGIAEHQPEPDQPFIITSNVISDFIYLNNPQHKIIKLYNSSGQFVGKTSRNKFDCRDMTPGVYFVKSEKNVYKIIKVY